MDKVCLANYCLKQGKSDNRSSKMKNSDNDIRSRIKQTKMDIKHHNTSKAKVLFRFHIWTDLETYPN